MEEVPTRNLKAVEILKWARLSQLGLRFVMEDNLQALLADVLKAAIEITYADKGNIQLIGKRNTLKIVAQYGFNRRFLDYFNEVTEDTHAACAKAYETKKRVIVEDVTESTLFKKTKSLEVLLEADVRAVQSTPLFTQKGEFLGIVSTHFKQPSKFDRDVLPLLDVSMRYAAECIKRLQKQEELQNDINALEKKLKTKLNE